jgi:hypothetical protein
MRFGMLSPVVTARECRKQQILQSAAAFTDKISENRESNSERSARGVAAHTMSRTQ